MLGLHALRPRVNVTPNAHVSLQPSRGQPGAQLALGRALRELKQLVDRGITDEESKVSESFLWNYTVNYGSTLGRRLAYRTDDDFCGIQAPGYLAKMRPERQPMTRQNVNKAVDK